MTDHAASKLLLLHPDDGIPSEKEPWGLVVDLGRAPASTYAEWSRVIGCQVMSLFDLSEGVADLHRTRELLELGMGRVVDQFGIDWWDVLVQSIVPQIQQLILLRRLAATVEPGAEIFCTRPHFLATGLQKLSRGRLVTLQTGPQQLLAGIRHYLDAFRSLDFAQLTQVLQDKFDPEHSLRSRFARRRKPEASPVVLLPSAYVNVSCTAVAYASMLPDIEFLLIYARNNGRLKTLPKNVRAASLDSYISRVDEAELKALAEDWHRLRIKLSRLSAEFDIAEASGLLHSIEARLRWGLAIRDAWHAVFDSETINACLCADDSNPYSRLPLIIARNRGVPALACHHGALDSRMAIKKSHADFYLAKSEMEWHYLVRVCRVAAEQIVIVPTNTNAPAETPNSTASSDCFIFFTEPFHAMGWRSAEIYRELLPRLIALARASDLELVLKLHPFESVRSYRNTLRHYLGPKAASEVRVIEGPTTQDLWQRAKCTLTVQSSIALECASRGIPVFLLGWLADPCAGYVEQFERFGVGHVLQSPQELDELPRRIASTKGKIVQTTPPQTLDSEVLR